MLALVHVDEVDDDEATHIAEPELAGDHLGGFDVGLVGHLLLVVLALGLARVDVDRGQRLGGVHDDAAAAGQGDLGAGDVFELAFEAVVRKQRHLAGVALDLRVAVHVAVEELAQAGFDGVVVDDDLVDVVGEVVAHRADDDVGFFVDEAGFFELLVAGLGVAPDADEVLVVGLQFALGAVLPGRAHDDAHVFGRVELGDEGLELLAGGFVFDLAADAAAAAEGHDDHVAAGQGDVGGEGCAFVADFFFVGLHEHPGAGVEHVLDAGAARAALGGAGPVAAVDVVEGDEPVTFGAVVDKRRLQAPFDADDPGFVDVALDQLVAFHRDIEIFEDVVFDDRNPDFAGLRGVDQHALAHRALAPASRSTRPAPSRLRGRLRAGPGRC